MNLFDRQKPVLAISRIALAFAWIYQGLVPKIVCRSPGEVNLLKPVAPVYRIACSLITYMGYGEILFGTALLLVGASWMFRLNIGVLVVLLGWVVVVEPVLFTQPFNPLTLNVALIGLSLVALHETKKNGPEPTGVSN